MPAYNFQPQFERPILADLKRHTIRAKRKRRPKVGDTCYLFVGLRHKNCKRLKARRCVKVEDIDIKLRRLNGTSAVLLICIDGGLPLLRDEAEAFARSDGFSGLAAMADFWDIDEAGLVERNGRLFLKEEPPRALKSPRPRVKQVRKKP